jgi:hypothetical protein
MTRFSRFATRSERERRPVRPSLETLEDRLVPSTMAGTYPDGVWRYDTTAGWSHISNMKATVLGVDDAGDVYGSFSGSGIWKWTASSASWSHISNLSAEFFKVTPSGVLYSEFGTVYGSSGGVWRWDPTSAGWLHLSSFQPAYMAVSSSDVFFGRFDATGAVGMWRWTPAAGWSMLTGNRVDRLGTDDAGDMVGYFDTYIAASQTGTWRWNPTSGWTRLTTTASNTVDLVVSANGAIFEEQGTSNVWRAAPGSNVMVNIEHDGDAAEVVPLALPDGGLYEVRIASGAFPHFSGWYWNGGIGFVNIIPSGTMQDLDTGIGKDGDLFFPTTPVGYWSLQTAFTFLDGNNQTPQQLASQR